MSGGISAARTSASLFCIFYISFLLFVLVPFLSSLVGCSHLPLFCSSQRNSTTHCCRFALFLFFFSFPFAYCSAPHRFHTLLGSGCRSRTAAGLPSNVRVPSARPPPPSAPLHLLLPERRCRGGEQRRQEWERHEAAPSLTASGRRSLRAASCCSARSSCRASGV